MIVYIFVFIFLLVLSEWEIFGTPSRKCKEISLLVLYFDYLHIVYTVGGPGDFFNYKRMYDNMQWGMVLHGGFENLIPNHCLTFFDSDNHEGANLLLFCLFRGF